MNRLFKTYHLFKVLIIILLGISSLTIKSQTIDPAYEVATWFGFCDAAISYTFDDGCSNQFNIAIPMLNELGFCGTFFTVTGWSPDWKALQAAAASGHEIASHTVNHPNFRTIDITTQINELKNSADSITKYIPESNGLTLAYPYCVRGNDSIVAQYYIAARGCKSYFEPATPGNFLNISSIVCGSLGLVNSADVFRQEADSAADIHGWRVYLIHGIDNDGGYSPLSSATLRKSLEYLDENRDKFWVATFVNIVRYINERNCLNIRELEANADTIRLELTDTLNNIIYNQAVTVRRPLPKQWKNVKGTQNGKEISTNIVVLNSRKYIEFNAIPDRGNLILYSCETLNTGHQKKER